jgi:PAS domain S-box-containing protein
MHLSLQDHEITEEVCATAFSTLYRARSRIDGAPLLIKALNQDAVTPLALARFKREYETLHKLAIQGVVKPRALLAADNRLAMVMEDVEGLPLSASLAQRSDNLLLTSWMTLAEQLAAIVEQLHRNALIHHELRPSRFLLSPASDALYLIDLSAATAQLDYGAPSVQTDADNEGLAYLSPEQTGRMNRTVDYRTDLYSLGILLYRLLTGRLPFQANDPLAWVHSHIARVPATPQSVRDDVPAVISDMVMKLLAKMPDERYQNAAVLLADLQRCRQGLLANGSIRPFTLGEKDVPERFQAPQKLYGRARESHTLLSAFEQTAQSGAMAVALVTGYSGIGKSSLVHELHHPIALAHGYFVSGKFDQFRRDVPYATVIRAVHQLIQQILTESKEHLSAWHERLTAALGTNAQLVLDVVPQLELIIGPQAAVDVLPPTEAQYRFYQTFARFVGAFAASDHPLTLFLDDLQWADRGSLDLLQHLLTSEDLRHLFIIGAYRDNEVGLTHPLTTLMNRIREVSIPIHQISVKPLTIDDVQDLVADITHSDATRAGPFAQLVYQKTGGNPFFAMQFLRQLHHDGLLAFAQDAAAWQWDTEKIAAYGYTDNVVDFMLGKLQHLSQTTRRLLTLAALVGHDVDGATLSLLSKAPEEGVHLALWEAMHEGLIAQKGNAYQFMHDRIQQAALQLVPESERSDLHLLVGRLLLNDIDQDTRSERVFDIASHFMQAAAHISEPGERQAVAELLLQAGRKARASTAYGSAAGFLKEGIALLSPRHWETQYALSYDLYFTCAECEWLSGQGNIASERIAELLPHAQSVFDKLKLHGLRAQMHTTAGEIVEAIESILTGLRLIGIDWPFQPEHDAAMQEFRLTLARLNDYGIDRLHELPTMDNPEMQAAMEMTALLMDSATYVSQNLLYLMASLMVDTSMKYGNCELSPIGYALFAGVLAAEVPGSPIADRLGETAHKLGLQICTLPFRAKLNLVLGGVVFFHSRPYRESVTYLEAGVQSGVESGDLIYALFCANNALDTYLIAGKPIDEIDPVLAQFHDFACKVHFDEVTDCMAILKRFILALQGNTSQLARMHGDDFDEAAFEQIIGGQRSDLLVCYYYVWKAALASLAGDFELALIASEQAKTREWTNRFFIIHQELSFYHGISLACAFNNVERIANRTPDNALALLSEYESLYSKWAAGCAANYGGKHALLAAELARLRGDHYLAMQLYDQSIRMARENNLVQVEALACELAAAHYRAQGFGDIADWHCRAAYGAYRRWGAHGKLKQLESLHPALRDMTPAANDRTRQLDVLSVIKASQSISGEIVLDRLLDKLMRIVLESAGARKGHLLTLGHDGLEVAVEASTEQDGVVVRVHRSAAPVTESLPVSILNYALRSEEPVLLDDARDAGPFFKDLSQDGVTRRSVLCLPILRQLKPIGLMYLENDLVTHAFTSDRMAVLDLLAAQIAISLETAHLYADLAEENEQRRRAEAALREREGRIRRLIESNIIGIFFWDVQHGITDANDAFLRIVGYSREALFAEGIDWRTMTPAQYRDLDRQALEALRTHGVCPTYEKEYVRQDGTRLPVLVGSTLLEGEQDKGVSFVLDLSERKQAESEREARRSAEAANRAKSEFLANMNHELRTPLNAILGFSRVIRQQPQLPEEAQEDVDIVLRNGEHLLTLIDQVLDLSKIEAGRMALNRSDCDLRHILDDLMAVFFPMAHDKNLQIDFQASPDVPARINTDELKVRQILINLINNAIKFTAAGSVSLKVERIPSETECRLHFTVKDTGSGIAAHELGNIFTAFVQTESGRLAKTGTGLGLKISQSFVNLLGGDIRVESKPGQGCAFSFDIPVQVVETDSTSSVAGMPTLRVIGMAPDQPRYRILIVDDVPSGRQLLQRILGPLEFELREAGNGQEAVDTWRQWKPDLIWMDMRMPIMDGIQATRLIRSEANDKHTVIVALTASGFENERQHILDIGCDDFLRKPFHEHDLFAMLQKHLGVEFLYDDTEKSSLSAEDRLANIDIARVHALPQALAESLKHALATLDSPAIALAIEQVQKHDAALARAMSRLARNFQYETLLQIFTFPDGDGSGA